MPQVIHTKEKRICVVEVEEGATQFCYDHYCSLISFKANGVLKWLTVPIGKWGKIELLSSLSEDLMIKFIDIIPYRPKGVKKWYMYFKDYQIDSVMSYSVPDSFHSLLRSHSIDTSKNPLILIEEI